MVCALLLTLLAGNVPLPALEARVNDHAQLLSRSEREALENRLADGEARTGHQFALLTLPTLEGEPLEDFSIRVAEKWKLGDKKREDGLIVIVVRDDHKIRIEVGYGLEGAVPDVVASRVIRETMAPHFRRGDYVGGIDSGFERLMAAASGEALAPRGDLRKPPTGRTFGWMAVAAMALLFLFFRTAGFFRRLFLALFVGATVTALGAGSFPGLALLVLGVVLVLMVLTMGWGRRSRRYWPGGWGGGSWGGRGFGGGGFRGGGGGFGGGGASGSW